MSGLSWQCRQCPVYLESTGTDESARSWIVATRAEHVASHEAVV